ncbi:hypothetical protein LIER_12686 [Lithospermum erythrorhizon]|uniref:Reverse transcriptase domain-containing protein n=1 Tax=Lithospermum erythrorhizon TaxID=34254 RepID=A0AAV3PUT7_LITER
MVDPIESKGCKPQKGLKDFTNCIDDCHLEDAGYIGSIFTWTNGSKFKRLDRVLSNHGCVERFSNVTVRHLAKSGSDHSPFLVECRGFSQAPRSSFRFQNMWLMHQEFMQVVADDWKKPMFGEPIYTLWQKLKRLKTTLKHWNKETFGNVFTLVEQEEDEVLRHEHIFEKSNSPADRGALHKAQATHLRYLAMEDEYWGQLSGLRWIKDGDKSTKVFHSFVKRKRKNNYIAGTMLEGEWITEQEAMADSVINFYKELFQEDPTSPIDDQLVECIPRLAVNFFLKGHKLPQGITSTVICLIPKFKGAKTWKEFRPINLCTFVNKIVTKLLNNRLATLLPALISDYQSGFVKGRIIPDNILLAQEMTHYIDKVKGVAMSC